MSVELIILDVLIVLSAVALSLVYINHSRGSKAFLCEDCRFNTAELCLKSERPRAIDCTSYRPVLEQNTSVEG